MNWLARLDVDAETAYNERIADSYSWHKKLWECFPDDPDAKRDFLTRIDDLEGAFRLWVMANRKPVCPKWCRPEEFAVKEIAFSFLTHRYYAFDLRANPVKALIKRDANGDPVLGSNGKWKRGKRVPLVKPEELRAWLIRKGEVRCQDQATGLNVPGGFQIVDDKPLDISPIVKSHFCKNGQQAGYHAGVQFRGTLEVTDRERFIETYNSGIGSAKGFGFGLLLISPITVMHN